MNHASEVWPYTVGVPYSTEAEKWLLKNLGPMGGRWYLSRYAIGRGTYKFSDEKDAVLFALRWA